MIKILPKCSLLLLPALILLFAFHAAAQTGRCTMELSNLPQSPELLGFHLGMSKEQVRTRVPQVVFGRTDALGTSKTTINPDFDPKIDKTSFKGARSVSLDFLDDQLTSLWIGFDSSFRWQTVDQFVHGISESLRLPDNWQPWKNRGQELKCADFVITVSMIADGPSFRILDERAADLLATRREEKEEQESANTDESAKTEEVLANTRDKTYYPGECRPAKPLELKDQTIFKSEEEAEKAGYKRAKICP